MKQSHLILTMGMIAWFSVASPELISTNEASNMVTQTLLYEPFQDETALSEPAQNETTLYEPALNKNTPGESPLWEAEHREAAQREEAIQLMKERRLDSRRPALQFLPFEPENRR